jgi:hypothetical protein
MGRIVTSVMVSSYPADGTVQPLRIDALVDTGASHLTLPSAWRERLGKIETVREVELETATQECVIGEICGPVRIEVEGFRPTYGEVLFIDMTPVGGLYEPLLGRLPLQSCQAAVDMLRHRLLHVKRMDLK